jgi:hypothetical protein
LWSRNLATSQPHHLPQVSGGGHAFQCAVDVPAGFHFARSRGDTFSIYLHQLMLQGAIAREGSTRAARAAGHAGLAASPALRLLLVVQEVNLPTTGGQHACIQQGKVDDLFEAWCRDVCNYCMQIICYSLCWFWLVTALWPPHNASELILHMQCCAM